MTMGKHLELVLPRHWGPVQDIQFQILKRHRTRCTFEIAWRGEPAWRSVIGKVYATDRADVYRAMEEIGREGFGPDDEFSIPEPLAYVPELRLLLQEKVRGARAKEVFLKGDQRDRVDAAERCARWLAQFQAWAPPLGRPSTVDDLLDSVREWSAALADRGWPLADKATGLARRIEAAAQRLRAVEMCAGHGHYTCGQILLRDGRTAVFDWDGYDVADPGRDVARFLVELKRIGWKTPASIPALDEVADVFLKTYLARSRPQVGGNVPFYVAAICLKLARKDLGREAARWSEKAAATLDEGLRALAYLLAVAGLEFGAALDEGLCLLLFGL